MKKVFATITLPNGQGEAVMLVSNPSKQLGIVDVATIKRLAAHLKYANLAGIREQFIEMLNGANDINEYVEVIAEEYNFQTTVNLLSELGEEEVEYVRMRD